MNSEPSENWRKIHHWDLVIPPSRPSVEQLQILRAFLRSDSRIATAAVLGSTVEYINLLQQFEVKTYVFEKDTYYYEQRKVDLFSKQTPSLVVGDWRGTLDNYQGRFDIIVSDLTSGNIPYFEQGLFWKKISYALAPGGLFFDKILTHPKPLIPLRQLFSKYSEFPVNIQTANYFSCEALFCSELLEELGYIDTTYSYRLLSEYSSETWWSRLLEGCKKITPEDCVWYYGESWSKQSERYFAHFCPILDRPDFNESPYYGRVKIIASKAKG
ncbi:MAG: hypothetical protein WDZ84_01470 [Rhodovibrionaceae bacterium]